MVRKAEEHKIKIDVIHIDGWQRKPDAGAWEWDLERFPDPERPLGDHRHLPGHSGVILQQCFGILTEQKRIVQISLMPAPGSGIGSGSLIPPA